MIDATAAPLPPTLFDEGLGGFRLGHMLIEVAIFAVLIYVALRFLWATRGSVIIRGLGLLLLGATLAFYLLIQQLGLDRLDYVLQLAAPSAVIGLIVVFQPEIRRG